MYYEFYSYIDNDVHPDNRVCFSIGFHSITDFSFSDSGYISFKSSVTCEEFNYKCVKVSVCESDSLSEKAICFNVFLKNFSDYLKLHRFFSNEVYHV